jgi:hypothetical protein
MSEVSVVSKRVGAMSDGISIYEYVYIICVFVWSQFGNLIATLVRFLGVHADLSCG